MAQLNFDFDALCPLPVLSKLQRQEMLLDFLKSVGIIDLVNLKSITHRPRQFELIKEVFDCEQKNLLIEGGTGLGKTLIFILTSLKVILENSKAVLVVPQDTLGWQCKKKFKKQTFLDPDNVRVMSGKISPIKRKKLFESNPKIIMTTPQSMITDFDYYDWDNIKYIMFDETQSLVGNSSALNLAKKIRLMKAEQNRKIRVCGMSATSSSNKANLQILIRELEIDKVITVLNPNDITSKDNDIIKRQDVELDPLSKRILNKLRLKVCFIIDYLRKELSAPKLFEIDDKVEFWMPSFSEISTLRDKFYDDITFKHDNLFMLKSKLSELTFLANLHSRLLSLGFFSFLEKYCYVRCQFLFQSDKQRIHLSLCELSDENDIRTDERGVVSQAKIRVLENEELKNLVLECTKNTPYYEIVTAETLDELMDAIRKVDISEDLGPYSVNAKRRLEVASSRNKYLIRKAKKLDSVTQKQALTYSAELRNYFSYALGKMARNDLNDHQKETSLLELLNTNRKKIPNISSFIFTTLTRHSEFLAERLEYLCQSETIRPIAVHGASGAGMDNFREVGLESFNSNDSNILVTTVQYAGTGIDVENATMGIHYALRDSNHVSLVQANGRVLGRSDDPMIYLLWSKGSQNIELKRYNAAINKERARRKYLCSIAKICIPEYDIEA